MSNAVQKAQAPGWNPRVQELTGGGSPEPETEYNITEATLETTLNEMAQANSAMSSGVQSKAAASKSKADGFTKLVLGLNALIARIQERIEDDPTGAYTQGAQDFFEVFKQSHGLMAYAEKNSPKRNLDEGAFIQQLLAQK